MLSEHECSVIQCSWHECSVLHRPSGAIICPMTKRFALPVRALLVVFSAVVLAPFVAIAQQGSVDATLARIRAEGLERSSAQSLYLTLTDQIGARLTGAPSHVKAAYWARDRFAEWGLTSARLEP